MSWIIAEVDYRDVGKLGSQKISEACAAQPAGAIELLRRNVDMVAMPLIVKRRLTIYNHVCISHIHFVPVCSAEYSTCRLNATTYSIYYPITVRICRNIVHHHSSVLVPALVGA